MNALELPADPIENLELEPMFPGALGASIEVFLDQLHLALGELAIEEVIETAEDVLAGVVGGIGHLGPLSKQGGWNASVLRDGPEPLLEHSACPVESGPHRADRHVERRGNVLIP